MNPVRRHITDHAFCLVPQINFPLTNICNAIWWIMDRRSPTPVEVIR